MAAAKKNAELDSVTKIVGALSDLDESAQDRVIASVLTLLGKSISTREKPQGGRPAPFREELIEHRDDGYPSRPKGLTELVREKNPGTNPQRIALFAYYRDKYEQTARFGRDDLRPYFSKAHLGAPANYDRDFSKAVDQGWIHEGGDQSYITTSGIEVVERGFEGERVYTRRGGKKTASAKRGGTKRAAPKKK